MLSTTKLAGFEIRRFKGVLPKIALGFLLIIPLMYGALYLWSNWDPYGQLDKVPVAVVNQDRPATIDGKTVDAGDQFIEELRQERIFDWHFTDAADAADGLAHGRYYLTITVPPDFSTNLASGAGDDPKRAVLMMHRDDVNGFVIGMLTASVQTKLESAIDKAAVGTYFDAVFGNLNTIRGSLEQAADGSGQITDGLTSAQKGAGDLNTGLTSATSGADQLASGIASAKDGAGKLAAGAGTAKTGADQLAAGLGTAKSGSADLAAGLDTLKDGSTQLVAGADQVAAGNKKLADTVVPVIDEVLPVLPKVTQAATDITGPVADLTGLVADGQDSLTARTGALQDDLAALAKAHPELAADPAFQSLQSGAKALGDKAGQVNAAAGKIADGAKRVDEAATAINDNVGAGQDKLSQAKSDLTKLADGSAQVASGARQLDQGLGSAQSGAHQLADGVSTAADGSAKLAGGVGELAKGAQDLQSGLTKLSDGAGSLKTGLGKAQQGSADLGAGLTKLHSGSAELTGKLADGARRIPVLSADDQDSAVQVLSQPADVQMTIDHPATYYGRGLAPFFFAIAIWVFGISVFLVMRPITGRMLAGRASALRLAMAGWLPITSLAVLGSLILLLVSWFALGLDPVHVAATFGVVVLAALCFSAIAYVLRVALGVVGSAATLVLLMLQLTSAGGLYPVETLPAPFRALNPVIPMTYLIDALRITFTGGPAGHLWRDVAVLGGFTVVALGLAVLVVSRRKQFKMKDLHPALG